MWQAGGCVGGGKLYILGVAGYITIYTHLGCFGARGGAGGGWRAFIRCQICPVFPIRQAVPVGLARAWFLLLGSLGSVFHRQKTVYWQIQYIYIYYTPFCGSREAGMGGWHWMDSDDVPSDYLTLDNIYCAIANITRKVYIYSPRKD